MSDLPTRILLATDGSEDATLAARAAIDLSQKIGAELHVVHAWQTVPSPHFETWINSSLEQEAQELLDEQKKKIEDSGGKVVEAYLRKNSPAEAIVGLANEIDADFIVIGSRGLGPVKRLLLGSVSEGVVHHAHVPVLILRGGDEAWPPKRMVVGEDASEDARRAGELAACIAELFGAEVLLAHVVSLQWMVLKAESQGTKAVDEVMRRAEEHLSEQAAELESSSGLRSKTRAVMGYPALTLAEISREEKQTLLAIGSRGLNAVKRVTLGSVSSNVLRTVEGPVLVVPPSDRQVD
ncbi:MAG: universal stress protein [Rubrobacteraceae bacterium]